MRKALVIGASGLIGQELVKKLVDSDAYSDVQVLVRREGVQFQNEVKVTIADFDTVLEAPENYRDVLAVDDLFCTIGTTQKAVGGDKRAFRRVDYDYPLEIGRICVEYGASRVFLVSSLGAYSSSPVFYNRTKGELEDAISALKFEAVHIYRPSLLLGKRRHLSQEKRGGEELGQKLAVLFSPLLVGPFKRWRPTPYTAVATAMARDAEASDKGVTIHYFPRK